MLFQNSSDFCLFSSSTTSFIEPIIFFALSSFSITLNLTVLPLYSFTSSSLPMFESDNGINILINCIDFFVKFYYYHSVLMDRIMNQTLVGMVYYPFSFYRIISKS